jgi:hypothetical protein
VNSFAAAFLICELRRSWDTHPCTVVRTSAVHPRCLCSRTYQVRT